MAANFILHHDGREDGQNGWAWYDAIADDTEPEANEPPRPIDWRIYWESGEPGADRREAVAEVLEWKDGSRVICRGTAWDYGVHVSWLDWAHENPEISEEEVRALMRAWVGCPGDALPYQCLLGVDETWALPMSAQDAIQTAESALQQAEGDREDGNA